MDNKKYNNVEEVIKEYEYNKKFSFYSTKYKNKIGNAFWSEINNNNDISNVKERVENIIKHYKNVKYHLVMDNIKEIEIAIGKYEQAISKIIQCYNYCDFSYSADELINLINNLDKYEDEKKEIFLKIGSQS